VVCGGKNGSVMGWGQIIGVAKHACGVLGDPEIKKNMTLVTEACEVTCGGKCDQGEIGIIYRETRNPKMGSHSLITNMAEA